MADDNNDIPEAVRNAPVIPGVSAYHVAILGIKKSVDLSTFDPSVNSVTDFINEINAKAPRSTSPRDREEEYNRDEPLRQSIPLSFRGPALAWFVRLSHSERQVFRFTYLSEICKKLTAKFEYYPRRPLTCKEKEALHKKQHGEALKQEALQIAEDLKEAVAIPLPTTEDDDKFLTPKDIGFFDPSLLVDFPELRLFSIVDTFIARVQHVVNEYEDKVKNIDDVLDRIPDCLRGKAYTWWKACSPENKDHIRYTYGIAQWAILLSDVLQRKPQPAKKRAALWEQEQLPLQAPTEYKHRCIECSASFSSPCRLLSHNQLANCNKPICKHCEQMFESNNKLHEHIRSCSASSAKNSAKHSVANSRNAPSLAVSTLRQAETLAVSPATVASAPATPVRTSAERSAIDSTSPTTPSAELSTPVLQALSSPLSTYRALSSAPEYRTLSPSPPMYAQSPRSWLTIDDLFIRYAPLKSVKSARIIGKAYSAVAKMQERSLANQRAPSPQQCHKQKQASKPPILTIQDLFQMFEKQHSATAKSQLKSPQTTPCPQRQQRAPSQVPRSKESQFTKISSDSLNNSFCQSMRIYPKGAKPHLSISAFTSDGLLSNGSEQQQRRMTTSKLHALHAGYHREPRGNQQRAQARRCRCIAGLNFDRTENKYHLRCQLDASLTQALSKTSLLSTFSHITFHTSTL